MAGSRTRAKVVKNKLARLPSTGKSHITKSAHRQLPPRLRGLQRQLACLGVQP